MSKGRLEAFSDAVIAILMTIMVLELRPPHEGTLHALEPVLPSLLTYVLSFVFLGIYWTNHHHLLQMTDRVSGGMLWANLHLLFWLSLVPFGTAWLGENPHAAWPTAAYGAIFLLSAIAYTILVRVIVRHKANRRLAEALGRDAKGNLSLVLYASAIPLAFVQQWLADGLYVLVALIWLVPDRRIESHLQS